MTASRRPAVFALLAAWLALAGCAGGSGRRMQAQASGAIPATSGTVATASDPAAHTGIAACDDYLAGYRACHRAARIFAPDQVEAHYRSMRDSLLDAAHDPRTRPLLGQRCRLLAVQLAATLHGAACAAP